MSRAVHTRSLDLEASLGFHLSVSNLKGESPLNQLNRSGQKVERLPWRRDLTKNTFSLEAGDEKKYEEEQ